jgi:Ca2+-binding RTX toxin-like protein
VDLAAGTGTADSVDTLHDIELVHGSALADILIGSDEHNALRGWFGDDSLFGAGGNDTLDGGKGSDELDGGEGTDICRRGFQVDCEPIPS